VIRFVTYVGPWAGATIEGFTFVKGEYLGLPARLAERVLRNPEVQERPATPVPPAPLAPEPLPVEPVIDDIPEIPEIPEIPAIPETDAQPILFDPLDS